MLKLSRPLFLTFIFLLFFALDATGEDWLPLTANLNSRTLPMPDTISTRHSLPPALALWKRDLLTAWGEPDEHGIQQIYIKKLTLNKTRWEALGKSHNKDRSYSSSSPFLATNGNQLYLASSEKNKEQISQIYVKKWTGTEWIFLGDSLNVNPEKEARNPIVAFYHETPYVAWNESGEKEWSKLYVKHWDGKIWTMDGPGFGLEPNHITMTPAFIFEGKTGHLVWPEADEARVFQIFYAALEGGNWAVQKASLNHDPRMHAFNPSEAFWKNSLYVLFQEKNKEGVFTLQLRHLTAEGWKPDTGELKIGGRNAFNPVIASRGPLLIMAWEEWDATGIPKIVSLSMNTSGILRRSAPLNERTDHFGLSPTLISGNDGIYLAWKENDPGDIYKIQVRKYSGENR